MIIVKTLNGSSAGARNSASGFYRLIQRLSRYVVVGGVPEFAPVSNQNRLGRLVLDSKSGGGFVRDFAGRLDRDQLVADARVGGVEIGPQFVEGVPADRASQTVFE